MIDDNPLLRHTDSPAESVSSQKHSLMQSDEISSRQLSYWGKVARYFKHASLLRCPVCGVSSIFLPYYKIKSIFDWFATRPSCYKCGYNYYREPGYFLTAVWFLNCQVVFVFGLVSFILFDDLLGLSFVQLLLFNSLFTLFIITITARHTKAFFMAFDHLVDPIPSKASDQNDNAET